MCGIGVCVATDDSCELLDGTTLELLRRRGPDHWGTLTLKVPPASKLPKPAVTIHFWSSVLSLRGSCVSAQPVQVPDGVLCFNGELYEGVEISPDESDTAALARAFCSASSSLPDIANLLSALRGPWAFVYVCEKSQKIFFGRDIFGRRCLLIRTAENGFYLSSVASEVSSEQDVWTEVPARGVYIYDIANSSWDLLAWDKSPAGRPTITVPPCPFLQDVPPSPECFLRSPVEHPLNRDLLNSPGHLEGGEEAADYDALLVSYGNEVAAFEEVLSNAVRRRLKSVSQRFSADPVGILFSGGIDSTVLAALALKSCPETSFDLINVAFEHGTPSGASSFDTPDRLTSIEAFEELSRTLKINEESILPGGRPRVRLVCVDVSYEELQKAREDLHVPRLVHPANTVLDDSLGFALWFAARARGQDFRTKEVYESRARLLVLGMGADEQLGGYSRHAASFRAEDSRTAWESLGDCIGTDIDRISWRNLGRDDRVLADLGKEGRTPFLDEEVVSFLNAVPMDVKMKLNLGRGQGDKLLLRLLAHKIGLVGTARRAKRALQFGSRIAHVDAKRSKGHLVCNRLQK